jgi:hypothetical protein
VWTAPRDGSYYVKVTNRAELTGCATDYEVWIEVEEKLVLYLPLVFRHVLGLTAGDMLPAGVITHACPDVYETDDTWEQAKAIEDGVPQVHSFDSDPTYYAADKDFVWFELRAGQSITFTVTQVPGTLTLLELYDRNGDPLGVTGTDQLMWTASLAGPYYLSVSPQSTASGCSDVVGYELVAQVEPLYGLYLPVVLRESIP